MKYYNAMRHTILILMIIITFAACNEERPLKVNVQIIQTTDVHGTIFPFDFINKKETKNSLANVYAFVKEVRAANPDGVVLLDNGDFLQGQPTVYYYNFEDTASVHLGAKVFNYMDYDAATVGNHDIEAGHKVYDAFRKQLKAPYIAANAVDKATGYSYFEPYTIIERKGVRIAVLGLITPGIPKWLPEKLWAGIEFEDMIESATKWMKIIKEKENPDFVIGMFHAGIDHTYENPEGIEYMNENATRLVAQKVPGFDVVLGGHDHKKYNEIVINSAGDSVVLLDPLSHSRAVSFINVDFTYNKSEKKYSRIINADIKTITEYEADAEFLEEFADEYADVKNYVGRKIGAFANAMDSKWSYFGNSTFMDFIHKVQLEISGADVSFSAPLNFRSKIDMGPIYVNDLFKLYKYENLLYTIKLKGAEIDGFLEYAASLWFNTMKNNTDHLLKIEHQGDEVYRFKNRYYNFSSAAGIDYLVDVSKPDGQKIEILGFSNARAFYADSVYNVALNSYRGTGGGGHLELGAGLSKEEIEERFVKSTDIDIRYLIMKYIEQKKELHPEENSNWRIIPEDYYEYGKRKDLELLFGKN